MTWQQEFELTREKMEMLKCDHCNTLVRVHETKFGPICDVCAIEIVEEYINTFPGVANLFEEEED